MSTVRPASAGGGSPLSRILSLVGVVLVGSGVAFGGRDFAPWVLVVTTLALAGWTLLASLPATTPRGVRLAVLSVMIVCGSVAAVPTSMVGVVPMIVGLVALSADIALPWLVGPAVAAGCAGVMGVVSLLTGPPFGVVLAGCGFALLGALLGVTRRQRVGAGIAEQRLAEQRLAIESARAHSAALNERARIARDLHDTLAHSLGGLVVQLDALEALAEAGRIDDVLARARAARTMAADGLVEARRAVLTLREEPDRTVDGATLAADVAELVARERSLGVEVGGALDLGEVTLDARAAEAVRRAAQEALTNARKHAPRRPVTLDLVREAGRVVLTVANETGPAEGPSAPAPLAASGSGSGLAGMRERAAALPGGSLDVSRADGVFRIRMEVETA